MAALLRSQVVCPVCDDLISSIHRHDFRRCSCGALSIDGGRDYMRLSYSAEVGELLHSEEGMKRLDRSIAIAGEHSNSSAALALSIYKALWAASMHGKRSATTAEVRSFMAVVGNRKQAPAKSILAYLKLFTEDSGPVERSGGPNGYKWLPKIPLEERSDA